MLVQVFYVSRSNTPASELESIVAKSRQRNGESGLTGALVSTGRNFAQVLEGDEDAIEKTLGRISADVRHDQLTVVQRQQIPARRFATWSMKFDLLPGLDGMAEGVLRNPPKDPETADRLIGLLFEN